MIEVLTFSEQQTQKIGRKLGDLLKAGDIVCLDGELGVGKTAFTRGVALSLGISDHLTSPSFSIVNEYVTLKGKFLHFDVYRLYNIDDLYDIGFDEYINSDNIIVIEWAMKIKADLPHDCNIIQVFINKINDENLDERSIKIYFDNIDIDADLFTID